MSIIFEKSQANRRANGFKWDVSEELGFDSKHLRDKKPQLPELSELDVVRYYTNLSQENFSIDNNFYPLGSCTMKYNPRIAHKLALDESLLNIHPHADVSTQQGFLEMMYDLQEMLTQLTGMEKASLTPFAGAHGEYAGVAMIRRYHIENGHPERDEIIVPDAAHGTNPATAAMIGCKLKEIPTSLITGDVDIDALKNVLGPKTAGIMLTNPSTVGVFEHNIEEIAKLVHDAGGLLYYDGANLNAIMGKAKPGKMGFDVMHMNVHKTFATPHGAGGPGSGPIAVNKRLEPFLPVPRIEKKGNMFVIEGKDEHPLSMGRLGGFLGNSGVLIRTYVYLKALGGEGLEQVSEIATLNANYMMKRMKDAGFKVAFPNRYATHEFICTLEPEHKTYGITATDFAKGLLDRGMHAPTMYFPMLLPEVLLIEPTETETKETLDAFIDAMIEIRELCKTDVDKVKSAPETLPCRRLDEVKAARELDINYFN